MRCKNCDCDIKFGEQMSEWDEVFGGDASTPLAVMIECNNCNQSVLVCVDTWEDPEEIVSPFASIQRQGHPHKDEWKSRLREGHNRQIEFFQKKSLKRRRSGGFTLIEVLVVIGIISVLATVVLVAVNPARQFKLARDSQRTSNVNALLNAIHQNMAEHKGVFTCSGTPQTIPDVATVVQSAAVPGTPGDIASCIVPDYLSSLPYDPSKVGAHYTSSSDYDTAYEISRDSDGRITASSTGELTPSISVTR